MVIVPYMDGAMSKIEPARLYCEDEGLPPCTPDAILARIVREYRPYDTMPEFGEGFAAPQARRRHENDDGLKALAYDRRATRQRRGSSWRTRRSQRHLIGFPRLSGEPAA
jgi:hypothetical protein